MNPETTASTELPSASAINAEPIVTAVAANDRKSNATRMTAARRPATSPTGISRTRHRSTTGPRIETSMPASEIGLTALSNAASVSADSSEAGFEYVTLVKAVVPSSENCNGVISSTPDNFETSSSASATSPSLADVARAVESVEWRTTSAESPAAAGNRSVSKSVADCESESPMLMVFENPAPTPPATPPNMNKLNTNVSTVSHGLRETKRPIQAKTFDITTPFQSVV